MESNHRIPDRPSPLATQLPPRLAHALTSTRSYKRVKGRGRACETEPADTLVRVRILIMSANIMARSTTALAG